MAGVTDVPFRRLCRIMGESGLPDHLRPTGIPSWVAESGEGATASSPQHPRDDAGEPRHVAIARVDAPAGLYVTEMVTSRALVENNERTWDMVRPDPAERVRSLQLYGVNPAVMAKAATMLVERDLTDHIDLNFGCPVPKVTKKGGGAALPWKRDLFTDLVGAVVRASHEAGERAGREIPVTVKIRIGIDYEHETATDAALSAQKLGAAARTQNQHYAGQAHWDEIARLKDLLDIPVFGNGDVFEAADALAMLEHTGCDGISVGRGAQGRPWIFRDIVAAYHGGTIPPGPSLAEVVSVIERRRPGRRGARTARDAQTHRMVPARIRRRRPPAPRSVHGLYPPRAPRAPRRPRPRPSVPARRARAARARRWRKDPPPARRLAGPPLPDRCGALTPAPG